MTVRGARADGSDQRRAKPRGLHDVERGRDDDREDKRGGRPMESAWEVVPFELALSANRIFAAARAVSADRDNGI